MKKNSNLNIKILPISRADILALLQFELENKSWFEQFTPARSAHFLTHAGMDEAVAALVAEMKEKKGAYYLAFVEGEICARVNFSCDGVGNAELGYRVGKDYVGHGIASYAIQNLLPEVKKLLDVTCLNAQTANNNPASIKVLENCGFNRIGIQRNAAQLHSKKIDLQLYEIKI